MVRTVAIGIQDFGQLMREQCFYVDKTEFIREWWENKDVVTLITRPRRFGKTLNMSMLEHFFSMEYAGQGKIFEGLAIWKQEKYRKLQGTYPVISLSFAGVKGKDFITTREEICQMIANLYTEHEFLRDSDALTKKDQDFFDQVCMGMKDSEAAFSLHQLSFYLCRYYGKKVLIFLDEYDTPMQEAYLNGFWEEMVAFTRSLFNSTFKTNPYMERAIMTGITRVSKESIFSDLNNLKVVTTTSDEYAAAFGFTEKEVFLAMDEFGRKNKEEVKAWYDGFIFGMQKDIYNPWSIINYLDTGKIDTYWANTSSNSLAGKLIQEGSASLKAEFELLLGGQAIESKIDEEIIYNRLMNNKSAIWSLLLASGYCKVLRPGSERDRTPYLLTLTNQEVMRMFEKMVTDWFVETEDDYNDFVRALLLGDLDAMNEYMGRVCESIFSSFDTGRKPSERKPERFYHGFVLGLLVELSGKYVLTSNRESGFGRYDILLEPLEKARDGIIIEFKVFDKRKEKTLEDTLEAALLQIEEKQYQRVLLDHGIAEGNIRKYGFAFEGKKVLIGGR